jgi:hypothetical protein
MPSLALSDRGGGVAQALEPLAGSFAAILYTIGLIGAGFLAIPILAGSSAYAFAEMFAWKAGLDVPVTSARYFYALIGVPMLLGIAMVFVKINPIKALFGASVIKRYFGPLPLSRRFDNFDQSYPDEASAEPLAGAHHGRTYSCDYVYCCGRDVFSVTKLGIRFTFGHLFCHPCGNSIYFVFSRDRRRPSFCRLYQTCSQSPMLAALPLCH